METKNLYKVHCIHPQEKKNDLVTESASDQVDKLLTKVLLYRHIFIAICYVFVYIQKIDNKVYFKIYRSNI